MKKKPSIFKSINSHIKSIHCHLKRSNQLNNDLVITNLLIILISFFYLLNMNSGHDWGGDFSMYIMNANNIAHGLPYAQTGYIYNNEVVYGTPAYPPVFPLLLSPLIMIFGLNLKILKLPGIVSFSIFLFYFNYKILSKKTPLLSKLLLISLIGFYPYFFFLSKSIMSDIPFMLFSYVALNLMNNQFNTSTIKIIKFTDYLIIGFFVYLAYGTRSIGIVLLPVYIFFSIFRTKKVSIQTIINLCFALFLMIIQNILVPETGEYFDFIPNSLMSFLSTITSSFTYYFSLFFRIFQVENYYLQSFIFIILIELFVLGFISRIKKSISSFELFFLLYFGVLLIWPSYQFYRFLVPIIPLFFLYFYEGLTVVVKFIKWPQLRIAIVAIVSLFVFTNYMTTYIAIIPRQQTDLEKIETQELFQFIQEETTSDDVILFFKPRVLALFTDRRSLAMAIPDPGGDLLKKMDSFGVTITVFRKGHSVEYQPELEEFIITHPSNFELLYNNSEFFVYKVHY